MTNILFMVYSMSSKNDGFRSHFFYTEKMIQYKLTDLLEIADRGFKTLFWGFDFWWTGEILKLQQKGKYVYLELVEYDGEWKVAARVRASIFNEGVCKNFLKETKLKSIDELQGMKILFHGKFSFHKEYHFGVIIDELSAEYTLGQMQKKQDDILVALEKMGILFHNKQLSWGFPPYTIALISGETSAGLKDFLKVVEHSEYNISYEEYFCAINGNNAQDEVCEQLKAISNDIKKGKKIDAVAIIRGGGGSSDIIRQNDLGIATEVCRMPVPVMVAIGHTQDRFILQDLARYGAKTPTDAAYKLIEILSEWDSALSILYEEIVETCDEKISALRENIDSRYENIQAKVGQVLREIRQQIDGRYGTICAVSPEKILKHGYAIVLQNGDYLDTISANNLKKSDSLEIKIYNKILEVKITDIKDL